MNTFNVKIEQTCYDEFDVSLCDFSRRWFRPPLAETYECPVFCSLPTQYATNVTLHTGTVL
jgi:hypothetical protein